jgi:hypothetical protein
MSEGERSRCDWFQEAARWYANKHQACPWCGGANQLYKSERGSAIEYVCGSCQFFTCHNREDNGYFMSPGRPRQSRLTMHAV